MTNAVDWRFVGQTECVEVSAKERPLYSTIFTRLEHRGDSMEWPRCVYVRLGKKSRICAQRLGDVSFVGRHSG